MTKYAIRMSQWLKSRVEWDSDRGDISITTIIIWVAAVAGAIAIAGTIGIVITRYNTSLSGV
ncbi:hypothetical protein [Streptomyces sp. NBC_00162]|uniref:hypothetical protein n=1 Tax=Streptomyces sp. NBC_00162 TaxID=2903629 RepID=UPI00214AECA9|nr:hypothetical protein [Streptomyces sp. NBC_00162]UUU44924.1 hypothetical protein JIW86_00575 [Streptomyces sp. NBC_00162]